jgi:hypothetical protein
MRAARRAGRAIRLDCGRGAARRSEGREPKLIERLEKSLKDFRAAKTAYAERQDDERRSNLLRDLTRDGGAYFGDTSDLGEPPDWFSDGADYGDGKTGAFASEDDGPPRPFIPSEIDWHSFLETQGWTDERVLNAQRSEWVYRSYQVYLFRAECGLLHQGLF